MREQKPLGRPREFDEAETLRRILDVFWTLGFEGTSLNELMEATGLQKGSLYAAFGDKRALFEAALDRYRRTVAVRIMEPLDRPDLTLAYLPHLDYPLQRLGPDHPEIPREVEAIDAVVGEMVERLAERDPRIVIVSEYAIENVSRPVPPSTTSLPAAAKMRSSPAPASTLTSLPAPS